MLKLWLGRPAPDSDLRAAAMGQANTNAGRNVYLSLRDDPGFGDGPLAGLPVSLKDCFDLAGTVTTCGSRFYAQQTLLAAADSWIAARLKQLGARIVGKTHLHPLAYGITGENPDYGDCTQPDDPTRLTGGSSSGAAASVQEGSAALAIGTDTGGSIRVPAALCGLAGYRASISLSERLDIWRGGVHLAPSFDTLGFLFRDLRDGPALAGALFGIATESRPGSVRVACAGEDFVSDCNEVVRRASLAAAAKLKAAGATLTAVDTTWWAEAGEIFAPIQAHEAARIHTAKLGGEADFSVFEPSIADRLRWGAALPETEIGALRARHAAFRARMDTLLGEYDFLLLPCAPMHALRAGADHTKARGRILRYTTPVSLGGLPAVTLPGPDGAGLQLAAGRGRDGALLAFAASL